ncbi:MAG TPA: alanine racemase [Anaerovoracaceae bacterium]|nr:alanine racemase [Anaerovoracaceae bacterium]
MKKNLDIRDTKVEIDLGVLAGNMRMIKDMVGDSVNLMAVVKANGYGHGALEIAETLMNNGASYLAVATLSEAMEIREKFSDYPILIMGHTPDKYLHFVAENNITPTIFTLEQAQKLNELGTRLGKVLNVHIKIDTGFHRLGFDANSMDETLQDIKNISKLPMVKPEGIFSHLALVNDEENTKQFNLFMDVIHSLGAEGISFQYIHIADSIATVDYPQYRLNMVRVGALIYGMRGFHVGFVPVEQIMTFKTAVSQLHNIKKGEGVSYDYLWKAPRDSIIATLPFGYADGYPRNMRGKGYVTIKGIKCPLVGVLCMDQCMADVTDVPGVMVGTEAIIYGMGKNEMTIAEAAELAETNKNDIIARITPRPPRIYK